MDLRKILVAHDFSEPADRALALAAELAQRTGAALHLVHVHRAAYDDKNDVVALAVPWPSPEQEGQYLTFLERELARVVVSVLGDTQAQVTRHVVKGDPVRRIEQLADELAADVVCIGCTGKGSVDRVLLGSVSQRLVRTSPRPVLTVH